MDFEANQLLTLDSFIDCVNLINDFGFYSCVKLKLNFDKEIIDTTLRFSRKNCNTFSHCLVQCYEDECCFLFFKYHFVYKLKKTRKLVLLVWTPNSYNSTTVDKYLNKSVELSQVLEPNVTIICTEKKSAEFLLYTTLEKKVLNEKMFEVK